VLGSSNRVLVDDSEILPQKPSTWYLNGFLVPTDAEPEEKTDEQSADQLDVVNDAKGFDDAVPPEAAAARVRYLPSSMGISLLVSKATKTLKITARWGDYHAEKGGDSGQTWKRNGREEQLTVELPEQTSQPIDKKIP